MKLKNIIDKIFIYLEKLGLFGVYYKKRPLIGFKFMFRNNIITRGISSAGERLIHIQEVAGSKPACPTSKFKALWLIPQSLF